MNNGTGKQYERLYLKSEQIELSRIHNKENGLEMLTWRRH